MRPDAVRGALLRPWRHGEHFEGCGVHLEEQLDLRRRKIRGFDLSSAHLQGGVQAAEAEFCGLAWLQGAQIDDAFILADATCRFDLRLDDVTCPALDLSGLEMQGVLRLDGAQIGELILTGAVLLANLSLADAKIDTIKAKDLTVMGGIWTADADLDNRAFQDAHIEGRV